MIVKWLDILLDYDFSVVHVKGIDNVLPDALSRLYPPQESDDLKFNELKKKMHITSFKKNHAASNYINIKKKLNANLISVDGTPISNDNNSAQNDSINFIINNCEFKDPKNTVNYDSSLTKNIFYVQSAQTICADYFSPPKDKRAQFLKDAHTNVGHYGAEQMVKHLHNKDGLHWTNLIGECVEFIRKCNECMRHNIQKKGYHPARHIYSYLPGQHLAIDCGGPISSISEANNLYFIVIVDVCTRFCILRPLPDKKTATIVKVLADVFALI